MPAFTSRVKSVVRLGSFRRPSASADDDASSIKSNGSTSGTPSTSPPAPSRKMSSFFSSRKSSSMVPTTSSPRGSSDAPETKPERASTEIPEPPRVATPEAEAPTATAEPEPELVIEAPPTDENLIKTILVLGGTGTGKTSFINLASGESLPVGNGLHSCTSEILITKPFKSEGHWYRLIDSPGFDDDRLTDAQMLKNMAVFLSTLYEKGSNLTGVVYLYRISDTRMSGSATRNFRMFSQMCGESAMPNVAIITSFWGKQDVEEDLALARETELRNDPKFFKPALDCGASLLRHENTAVSAGSIMKTFAVCLPTGLAIQRELVDQKLDLAQTAAGRELDRELTEQKQRHEESLKALKDEMEEAIREKDEEAKQAIESESRALQSQVSQLHTEATTLSSEYTQQKDNLAKEMQRASLEAEDHCYRVQALEAKVREISSVTSLEKRRHEDEITLLRTAQPVGVFALIGASVGGVMDTFLKFPLRL